jgi:hypothetical protein
VFRALTGRNQTGVHRGVIEVFFHRRFAFFNDAFDAVAMLTADLFVEARKGPFESPDVSLGLPEMVFEGFLELGR